MTTSYRSGGRCCATIWPEASEISRSLDAPPINTPTRILPLMQYTSAVASVREGSTPLRSGPPGAQDDLARSPAAISASISRRPRSRPRATPRACARPAAAPAAGRPPACARSVDAGAGTRMSLGRVLLCPPEPGLDEVRVVEELLQRSARASRARRPARAPAATRPSVRVQHLGRERRGRARRCSRRRDGRLEKRGSSEQLGAAGDAAERAPVLVEVRQDRDVAVLRGQRAALAREQAHVARGPLRRLERAAPQVLGHHERDHRLEHRDLDLLALAGALAVEERRVHRGHHRERRRLVRQDRRHEARLAAAVGREHREPRGRLDRVVVGRPVAVGPGRARSRRSRSRRCRVDRAHVLVPEAAAAPAPPAGSCARARPRARRGAARPRAPCGCFRSSTTPRLLRLQLRKSAPMSGMRVGPTWRLLSPPGGSTLTTSAPRSPSSWQASGPSTTVASSSTRTPAKGPGIGRQF